MVRGLLPGMKSRNRKFKEEGGLAGALLHKAIPSFKHGGKVKKTGIYKLHAGETVVPAGKNEVESFRRNHLGHKS